MFRSPALSILLLSLLAHQKFVHGATGDAECERVITDDYQQEGCLNLQNSAIVAPPPVLLESTITNDKFICKDKPTLYTFSCTLYGLDLVWYFNGEAVIGFIPQDMVGTDAISMSYPRSAPVYNVTAMLTLVSNETRSLYNVPYCISILTVQSFNESQADAPVIPFTVSCRTHCADDTQVCQVKAYQVAGTPTAPEEFMGTIQNVSDDEILGAKAIASLNWSLPDNENETAIDYYEITLMGTHTNSTMLMHMTDPSLPMLSYKYVLSEGNYTAASITAVDLCGQRSEPSLVEFMKLNATINFSGPTTGDIRQNNCMAAVGSLGLFVVITIVESIALGAILVVACVKLRWYCYCYKKTKNKDDSLPMAPLEKLEKSEESISDYSEACSD